MRILLFAAVTGFALITIAPISSGNTQDKVEGVEQAAKSYLDEALRELVAVLSDDSKTKANRLRAVENIVRQRLDYTKFSGFALSRAKSRFSEAQLGRYECEFDAYLSNYIGSRLVRYHQEQVKVFRANAMPNGDVILSARISGGQYDQAVVTFLMRKAARASTTGGEWRAIDIAFEGTKVRKLLRAQFQSILKEGGPDHLIATLKDKTPGKSRCAN
jgi:ABC-type transporter MlaC component